MSKRVERVKQSNAYFTNRKRKEEKSMVPVIDEKGKCLFPTKERRARRLLERGEAKKYWQKGIFCIKLLRKETEKREEYPAIALGIDAGSKREGYTVATEKAVVLNITTNTPYWVKAHMETRRMLRRSRRQRKTPYRACRENRATLRKENRIPPSTKSRVDAKLRIIKQLLKILPITILNIEDIKAVSKEGKKKWNISFSPLEVGKKYFYKEIENLGAKLLLTKGYNTKAHRDKRGFKKSNKKLDYVWEAHNVDSHSLCEIALGKEITPHKSMYKITFLEHHRRQLQKQNISKGGHRLKDGKSISAGMGRGMIMKDIKNNIFCFLGGQRKVGIVSIHSIVDKSRINQNKKLIELKALYNTRYIAQFIK